MTSPRGGRASREGQFLTPQANARSWWSDNKTGTALQSSHFTKDSSDVSRERLAVFLSIPRGSPDGIVEKNQTFVKLKMLEEGA